MPVTGRRPKPAGEALNRNPPVVDWTEVPDVPFAGAPSLGVRPGGGRWPAASRRWWGVVSSMPHCVLWTAADWQFARETAEVLARWHEGGASSLAAEVRVREKVLGTTGDFRRDLRIRYVLPRSAVEPPEPVEPDGAVSRLDDYRDVIGG